MKTKKEKEQAIVKRYLARLKTPANFALTQKSKKGEAVHRNWIYQGLKTGRFKEVVIDGVKFVEA